MTIVQTNPCSKVAALFRVGGLAVKAARGACLGLDGLAAAQ